MARDRRDFLKQCALATLAVSVQGAARQETVPAVRTVQLGDTRLDIINIGDITLPLAGAMRAPPDASEAQKQTMQAALATHRLMPMQDVLLRRPGLTLLVDAGAYDIAADSTYHVPGYAPPPPLAERLALLGVAPEAVQHVVITHRHWDHFNGATLAGRDGTLKPLFPNARHHVQRADWAYILTKLGEPATRLARTFNVLHPAGLIDVVDGDLELVPGVRLLAAPGETPGHQAVRVESSGEIAYLVGDMIHHPAEVAAPGFMVDWADQATNVQSRQRIHEAAAKEGALIVASHVREVGRISGRPAAFAWTDV